MRLEDAELLLQLADLVEHLPVSELRDRVAVELDRQPDHRDQVGDDQDDVLRDLRPGHRAHAAEHRADQDAEQADEDRDLEWDVEEARGDDADAEALSNDVGERGAEQHDHAANPCGVPLVAHAEEIGHRELAELAQIGREQDADQDVAAGPAEHVAEAAIAPQIQAACHRNERGRAHPVGSGRHAVEERRHHAPGHVVLRNLGGARDDADVGVDADGKEDEAVADDLVRHAHLLEDGEHDDEADEAAGVDAVDLAEIVDEALAGGLISHAPSVVEGEPSRRLDRVFEAAVRLSRRRASGAS